MKKTLVSALTTALVVGAASTTFAASNPFADVPADHWAYDAVSQLAADGVIEGYGDGTYRGDNEITRYEMAQMVAKAMAKSGVSDADKALIEKLSAEFADELNNLGVRVASLERNADMVKWNGQARYTMERHVDKDATATDSHTNEFLFRLEPSAEVNSNWHVNARLDAKINAATDEGNDGNVSLKRIWAQGNYDNFAVKLGRFGSLDNDSIFDTQVAGAEVAFGNKVQGILGAGRQSFSTNSGKGSLKNESPANHYYAGVAYKDGKAMAGLSYHTLNLRNSSKKNFREGIAKAGYRFDKSTALNGFYAKSRKYTDSKAAEAYSVEFDYKGADQMNAGTWGAWLAYRHLGQDATQFSTYDAIKTNEKGWEIGGNYTFAKNIVGTLRYGNAKQINGDGKAHTYFGRVQFFF